MAPPKKRFNLIESEEENDLEDKFIEEEETDTKKKRKPRKKKNDPDADFDGEEKPKKKSGGGRRKKKDEQWELLGVNESAKPPAKSSGDLFDQLKNDPTYTLEEDDDKIIYGADLGAAIAAKSTQLLSIMDSLILISRREKEREEGRTTLAHHQNQK